MRFPFNTQWKQLALVDAIPQSADQIKAELSTLHQQGKLCIPALIELNSPLGCICISTDLTAFLLNHPKAGMMQRHVVFLKELLDTTKRAHSKQDPEHFRLDPFASHRVQHFSSIPSECLRSLCLDLCPDWIDEPPKISLCSPRSHEQAWRGDTEIFEAKLSCHEQSYSSHMNPSDPEAGMKKAIEATYLRRDEQACNLIASLGSPTHSAFYEPDNMPDYPGLWSAFQAEREATILKLATKSTASRPIHPRM